MYRSPVRDIAFTLKHVAGVGPAMEARALGDLSEDLLDAIHQHRHSADSHRLKLALAQNPANFGAMLKIADETFKINAPGDQYEQEAERVADQVMRMPKPQLQRKSCSCGKAVGPGGECAACKRKKLGIQRMTAGDASHIVIDNVELAMWIAGVSLKSAKHRRKRMAA